MNEERTIEISIKEYARLVSIAGRVAAFQDFLKASKYLERGEAIAILGLDLQVETDD